MAPEFICGGGWMLRANLQIKITNYYYIETEIKQM